MSYESKIIATDKEHIYVAEVELDYCGYTFGEGNCSGGLFSIVTQSVSVDDFNVGDLIEGDLSGAIGIITAISGSSPTYTFEYTSTNGLNFQISNEYITNNTATGEAVKTNPLPTLLTADDDKCFQTLETCQDLVSYQPNAGITTGSQTIDYNSASGVFTRASGSYVTDGFVVGDRIKVTGYSSLLTNGEFVIDSMVTNAIYVVDGFGAVTETGDGDEVIELIPRKIYRFCEARSPHPIGIDAIPSLESVNITAAKIDVSGGMGERSSVSLSFRDHPHSDIGIDQYLTDRSWDASQRGLYWTKLRARNPNYQYKPVKVLTGYLDNGIYFPSNFKTRNYVIEKLDVTAGKATITGKDPLKLAASKKAQVPTPNTGTLLANITAGVGTATLTPTGIGNTEYAASGHIVIESEIMSFTRSGDVLTITRGQKNTTAAAHTLGDAVQECYVKNEEVNIIVEDILTNFANVDSGFIDSVEWQTEIDAKLNGKLDGIIPKPTDVNVIFKELALAKPLSLYWDEINQHVRLIAIQEPPSTANLIDMDSGFVAGSFTTKDIPKMRVSTVHITFGQIDPTKSLNEANNYTQTVTRSDLDSISKYGTNEVKSFFSRWINSGNKPAAQNAAQLYGRRFADIPREVSFSLEAKDSAVNIGQTRSINHRDIVDSTGTPVDTIFQIISAKEDKLFKYRGIEYRYGPTVDADNDIDTDTVLLSIDEQNVNLLTRYTSLIGAPDGSTEAVFQVENGVVIGSSSTGTDSIETGSWPSGATVTIINNGHIVGAGGDGGLKFSGNGGAGGDAINMGFALTIENNGVIGGGGGGGGAGSQDGGGGAGDSLGIGSPNGTLENGGTSIFSGHGGDLGSSGTNGTGTGGAAGKAIDKNGFTLTYTTEGDIRGTVS